MATTSSLSSSTQWGLRPNGRPNAVPRFVTPRDPDRETWGGKESACAKALGTPYMPWQRHAADLALELDPVTGLAYTEVDVLVPRQQGKSTCVPAKVLHRSFGFAGPQSIAYTAQSRGKARQKWADDFVPALQRGMFRRLIRDVRYANDSEALTWKNGSRFGIESGTETGGHGGTNDVAILDEAFAHVDARIEQALSPTMVTRPDPQIYLFSTAGNSRSLYLRGKVDRGRERVLTGQPSRVAYIEYSAADDDDPLDEEVWWRVMPALGYTISLDAVRAQLAVLGVDEFRRAFLNQWPDSSPVEQVIKLADWQAAADVSSRITGARRFSFDVTPDRAFSAIGVAGNRADGLVHIEVVKRERGTTWAPAELRRLTRKFDAPDPVVLCGAAAAALQADIEAEDVPTVIMSLADQRTACGGLYDSVPSSTRHIDQVSLNTALAGAERSESGGTWTWKRRSGVDICPLVAVTGARWGWLQGDAPVNSFYAEEVD